MARYHVRTLEPRDFVTIMELENVLFGHTDDGVLGPYYVRLCCEFFTDSCFVVEVEGRIVGYLLSFTRGREAYCTTLAILPEYQGTRAIIPLIRAFACSIIDRVETCWFTVEEDNQAARALHQVLGAREVEVRPDFYGPGRDRIVSRVDQTDFARVRSHLERLGLIERSNITAPNNTRHVSVEATA